MKIALITLIIIILTAFQLHCQTQSDTITMVDNGYVLSGKFYSPEQIYDALQNTPAALEAMRWSVSFRKEARVSAYVGGFCIGLALVQYLQNPSFKWPIPAVGVGLILVSFQCGIASRNHGFEAVRLYNSKVSHPSALKASINLGLSQNGIGIICRF